jgi:hypothetical protein
VAFPTTSVLDTFTGTGGIALGADWTVLGGAPAAPRLQDNAAVNVLENYSGAYWDTETFGPDCEVFATLAVGSDYFGLYARVATPGGSFTGYQASWSGSTVALIRKDGGSDAELDTATVAKSVGDKLGLECIGTAIKVYTKTGAGAWTERCAATDGTYTGAGNIAMDMFQTVDIGLDDFGGGDVVGGGTDYTGNVPGAAAGSASGPTPGVNARPFINISVS